MRQKKWFISNLDDSQRKVIIEDIEKSIIVQGMAGSGKTNLAIHRALQAKGKGSYAIVIMTVALRRMIAYGMKAVGLDSERIAYEWSWINRGFDLEGDVFNTYKPSGEIDENIVYLVNGKNVRKFELAFKEYQAPYSKSKGYFGIDFADWVDYSYYKTWHRRTSWFKEVPMDYVFNISDSRYNLVPSGTLYKSVEDVIDYIVVDEAQDFCVNEYKTRFIPKAGKSISLLGDSNQKMIKGGNSIQELQMAFPDFKPFKLKYNYRLPKSIAKVAQKISNNEIDLMSDNLKDNGNSDFPNFPKPIVKKCGSREDEIRWIANLINNEGLDDVAILVLGDANVQEVIRLLAENGIEQVQTHYRTRAEVPFHTVNTLDFSNNELPCILDYYAAKGSEFDNVFVPFANEGYVGKNNDFFVACTRSSHSLYITYSGIRTSYLRNVNKNDIVEYK
ncbi:MAG: DEAD/DEAH box helicase [Bacteroidales bacterium]|nr:DEAD/DEAH box helicase [Bacteroidales bacterium]